MPGTSKTTRMMGSRLPNEIADRIEARAKKLGISVGEYIRRILVLQVGRKHHPVVRKASRED